MIDGLRVLAFIPARSGSQGLSDKNIRPFRGKPLLAWSIAAAVESGVADYVLVSTDSEQYASVARQYGAEVPFLRPESLSGHQAALVDAINDSLLQLKKIGQEFDLVLCLQPTSPLRTAQHIKEALNLYVSSKCGARTMVSVTKIAAKYGWLLQQLPDERIAFLNPLLHNQHNYARQQIPPVFLPNGAIFIAECLNFKGFYTDSTYPYVMPAAASVDIDSLEDFIEAEAVVMSAPPIGVGADIAK